MNIIIFLVFFPHFVLLFRQELLQEREKHKEEEVEALKRSMQSGMVSFRLFAQSSLLNHIAHQLLANYAFSRLYSLDSPGTSNERASSAQGGDGLPVQNW